MMKKILGILVCTLLIITALSATGSTNVHNSGYVKENKDLELYQSNPTKSPDIITIKIEAQVTGVQDPNNLLEGKILVNDSITGKYNYDSGTTDSDPDPNLGEYKYNSSTFGIELEAGGFVFKTNPNNVNYSIILYNDYSFYTETWDIYGVGSSNNSQLSNGVSVSSIIWLLIDNTSNALSSDALPTTAPVLSDWTANQIMIQGYSPPYDFFTITANVTKVTKSKSKTRDIHFITHPILIWLLERFPNLYPILKHILRYQ